MSAADTIRRKWWDLLSAMQFLTRIPVPPTPYDPDSLARAAKFFPLVGLVVGLGAAMLHLSLATHLPCQVTSLVVLLYLVLVTGGLHEDGLADVADGFGGGSSPEKILLIMRDSRIGSYGGLALLFSLLGRCLLITSLPLAQVGSFLIAAQVLSRWTALPLSYFLPSARVAANGGDGLGARIASRTSLTSLVTGTVFAFSTAAVLLRKATVPSLLATIAVMALSGLYYKRRIGGTTGDCFGATIQLAELGVYLCGAWIQ